MDVNSEYSHANVIDTQDRNTNIADYNRHITITITIGRWTQVAGYHSPMTRTRTSSQRCSGVHNNCEGVLSQCWSWSILGLGLGLVWSWSLLVAAAEVIVIVIVIVIAGLVALFIIFVVVVVKVLIFLVVVVGTVVVAAEATFYVGIIPTLPNSYLMIIFHAFKSSCCTSKKPLPRPVPHFNSQRTQHHLGLDPISEIVISSWESMPDQENTVFINQRLRLLGCHPFEMFIMVTKEDFDECNSGLEGRERVWPDSVPCPGDDNVLITVRHASGRGRHPYDNLHLEGSGFSPGDNLYFISSNRDNCLKGHKFIVKVKQDPACHAACCSNSDEYCFFRDSSPELNCIFAASDFPHFQEDCDDGNPETEDEQCTARGACIGLRHFEAFFDISQLRGFFDKKNEFLPGAQGVLTTAMKNHLQAQHELKNVSMELLDQNIRISFSLRDENVNTATLQSRLFSEMKIGFFFVSVFEGPATTSTIAPNQTISDDQGRSESSESWSSKETALTAGIVGAAVALGVCIIIAVAIRHSCRKDGHSGSKPVNKAFSGRNDSMFSENPMPLEGSTTGMIRTTELLNPTYDESIVTQMESPLPMYIYKESSA
eukprot:gene11049-3118_t